MDRLRRLIKNGEEETKSASSGTPMTEARIDFGFRIYWTKMATQWERTRVDEMLKRMAAVTQQPDFAKNLIERRYKVEGLDEQAHSGASLLALIEVLTALQAYDANNK
jgi:hypothetical protein